MFRPPVTHTLPWVVRPMFCMALTILTQYPLPHRFVHRVHIMPRILGYMLEVNVCYITCAAVVVIVYWPSNLGRAPYWLYDVKYIELVAPAMKLYIRQANHCLPIFLIFLPFFRLYGVVSLHMRVSAYMHRTLLKIVLNPTDMCGITVRRPPSASCPTRTVVQVRDLGASHACPCAVWP